MTGFSVVPIDRLVLGHSPWEWPFAHERRHEIEGHVFRGRWFETDYASLLAWRDWDFPDRAVKNSFAMGALRGSDGGFLLGEMGAHTANAGDIYFPAGTPEPDDVIR